MRHALSRAALVPLVLLLVAACASPGPGATVATGSTGAPGATTGGKVEAEDVAEQLMTALRDGKVTAAWDIVSTGRAEQHYNGIADFTAKMIAAGRPASWDWEPLGYEGDGDQSYIVMQAPVTFDDGTTGHVKIRMQALGLQLNPWRVEELVLEQD